MKKNIFGLSIFTVFLITLIGCSNEAPKVFDLNQLTRVDVQIFSEENSDNEIIIAEKEKIKTLREVFARIVWEQNAKVEMAREEDAKTTLFFTFDKNMPERLFEYFIWFNTGDASATIIDREKNALGKFDKEDTQTLKEILLNN
ncbi:hypothetical protein ACFFF5_16915 [Lederbergia wuyishanensis]|uniref:Lipoprotein n=1 Tax=Lederbergia wuyishanensis TaxID=1347903 RepID=A0ABU0D9W8_9BACI|nr:hypothetical protein [Lederbergia wuyishanensis]MCJ8008458.1 hypothetical protein [Lederbergia wuyishanensis]MDQ0345201.1 hypothetical protein [Lederbergia wuyishanensis]